MVAEELEVAILIGSCYCDFCSNWWIVYMMTSEVKAPQLLLTEASFVYVDANPTTDGLLEQRFSNLLNIELSIIVFQVLLYFL